MILNRENTIDSLKNNRIEERNGIKFQEFPFVNKTNIRIDPEDKNQMSICGKILDTILPLIPNTYVENHSVKIVWLSPNEWLVINGNDDLFNKLQNKIGDNDASVTDVTENRTVIRLSGEKIFTLLSKFLVLDLEKSLKDQSSSAQTLFVKVPVLLLKISNNQTPEIDIFANRSHANFIYNLLKDGSKNLDF